MKLRFGTEELTEEQKMEQDKNYFYNAISNGNLEAVTEFLNKGNYIMFDDDSN